MCLLRHGLFSVNCFPPYSFFLLNPRILAQCICTTAPRCQIYSQHIQIITKLQKSVLAGGLLGGEEEKQRGSGPRGIIPVGPCPLYFSSLIRSTAGFSLSSWRGCAESLCPFEVPDFFLSPAKAFLEHWRDVQVGGLRAPECLFAQLASLQV